MTAKFSRLLPIKVLNSEETSMTRKELEIPIEDDAAMSELLVALGYHPVPSVIKCRKYLVLDHMTACLDSVEGLGEYLELEILVEQEEDRQAGAAADRGAAAVLRIFHAGYDKDQLSFNVGENLGKKWSDLS